MRNSLRAVIFDLNGVLTTDLNQEMPALAQVLGINVDAARVYQVWHPLYIEASLGHISADELWSELRHALAPGLLAAGNEESHWLDYICLREPDLARTLARLQVRYTLGIMSNHVGRWARALLARDHLLPYLTAVLISSDMGVRKPDPRTYLRICELCQVSPSEAVYVADEQEDLRAAQAVGMRPFFIPGEDAVSEIGQPVSSIAELAVVL